MACDFADPRAVPVLQRILRDESDRKLRMHAENGLDRLRAAGLVSDVGNAKGE